MTNWILIAAVSTIAWNTRSAPGADKVATRSVDETIALKGDDFRTAINDFAWRYETLAKLSFDDMFKLVEHCAAESPQWPKDDHPSFRFFQELAQRCARQAAPSELDRVVHFVATLPIVTYQRVSFQGEPFISTAARLLRREMEAIRAEHRASLQIEPSAATHPESKAPVPPFLDEGWRRYVTVAIAADPLAVRPKGTGDDIRGDHRPVFQGVLSGERKGIVEELARYRISRSCMDEENVSACAAWAQWLALARERRLMEAIGLSFSSRGLGLDADGVRLRRQFTEACGVDATQLVAGMILATAAGWKTPPIDTLGGSGQAEDLEALASGSDREAEIMLQIADIVRAQPHVRADQFSDYEDRLGCFAPALGIVIARSGKALTPPEREPEYWMFGMGDEQLQKASTLPPLPQPLRARAGAMLLTFLDPVAPLYAIESALDQVTGLGMREARGSVRKLRDHWSDDVRTRARIALCILGEKRKGPEIPKTVVFQLVGNAGPLSHCNPYVDLVKPGKPSDSTNVITFDAAATQLDVAGHGTDAKGMIAVSRSDMVDPVNRERFAHLTFSHGSGGFEADKDGPAPLFCVTIPVPKDLNTVTRVAVDTHRVTFRLLLNRLPEFYRGKRLVLTLKRLDTASWQDMREKESRWWLPITEDLVLPNVQAGFYSVMIESPGAVEWRLDHLEVRKGMKPVEVKPATATDVRLKVVFPNRNGPRSECLFYREGQHFRPFYVPHDNRKPDDDQHTLGGFLPGSYKVRVRSSAELNSELNSRRRHDPDEVVSQKPGYEGAELSFEIPADSPPELDIGVIRLKEAK